MTYIPTPKASIRRIAFSLIIVGILMWMASSIVIDAKWLFQLAAIVMVGFGIFVTVRYVLPEYKYIIDDESGAFLIIRTMGKNEIKVCHLSFDQITAVTVDHDGNQKYSARYNYCRNPGKGSYIIFRDGDNSALITFEPDGKFAEELSKRIGNKGDGRRFAM